ncbi:hypothetical protein, partial [Aeromonas dhakensis]|uniref:hypothetical protein n=1 Tax=Aeromonas dhakensis TaxID=196024 RepID=UPI003BA3938F
QPKETNPTLGACFVLDIAQSLLGGSSFRARILPEWLTKNYTAGTPEANNLFARATMGRQRRKPWWQQALPAGQRGCDLCC